QDVDVRDQQVGLIKGRFKEVIQRYAETEREHRAKQRLRLERQIKVVNPSLPPEEVQDLLNRAEGGESTAVFAQATTGYRSQAARGALREVQTRAAELARIEQTLIELAQLFQDMAIMVEAQDVVIAEVEQTAAAVSYDMEKGVEQVQVAVKHARNARRFRWICFGLLVLILVSSSQAPRPAFMTSISRVNSW
ncbi:t-SNARE, partial [Rhodotorula sp. JG-1b]